MERLTPLTHGVRLSLDSRREDDGVIRCIAILLAFLEIAVPSLGDEGHRRPKHGPTTPRAKTTKQFLHLADALAEMTAAIGTDPLLQCL